MDGLSEVPLLQIQAGADVVFVPAEIWDRSPRFHFYLRCRNQKNSGSKYRENIFLDFENKITGPRSTATTNLGIDSVMNLAETSVR